MRSLIPTERVTVVLREPGDPDRFGVPTCTERRIAVDGVLFAPASSADLDAARPDGTRCDAVFHFPEGCGLPESIAGANIERGDRSYRVVGDPVAFPAPSVPGPWCLEVRAVDANG